MAKNILKIEDKFLIKYLDDLGIKSDNNIFNYIMNLSGEVYRQVKSRSTIKVNLGNQDFFIKKHYYLSVLEILKNFISLKSPFVNAITEKNAIEALKEANILTMDIAGYGVEKSNKLFGDQSFIITKAILPSVSLDKLCENFLEHKYYFKLKRILIKNIALITRKMHLKGLNHRDYYLCHYLLDLKNIKNINDLNNKEDNLLIILDYLDEIYLIDLHRMQIREKTSNRYIIKDLSAMLFSVRNLKLSKSDCIRFIKYYINLTDKQEFKNFMKKEKLFWTKVQSKADSIVEKG